MIVSYARIQRVSLPLVRGFQTSSHSKRHLEHLIVSLHDDAGNVGWGEIASASHPYFSPETTDTCWEIATAELIPALLGKEWSTPQEAINVWDKIRGNYFAKSGVEMAIWDLYARSKGVSLAGALGGVREEVVAGVSLGIEPTVEQLLRQVQTQLDYGYRRIKLKIAPGWDIEPVAAVRERFGDILLHVDANGVYSESSEDLEALHSLDRLALTMIEQPFAAANFLAHARLQAAINTPVCLDESIETIFDLETAIELEALQVLNIKVSRMGGLSAAISAHDLCMAHGIPVWCGGMHEFGVGRAANVALSSLPGFVMPSDVSASEKYYHQDIVTQPITASGGRVRVPTAPGLGYEVDVAFLEANTSQSETFAARAAAGLVP
ncbi:o-succinylbenzoate synthase [Paenarthrobacter sp. OM7]|uniref:o-succinylbenzoate synthase n=1 Tax=Paenarthrobacter sp. AMU7 TaxID=3162492 RepID=A0AB39YMQ2_9MICC|nr:o-succinylbenzoate synthase [Paenarthrobacter sp. OM7]WGM20455.1 o-succinylbenzoate synthase [Paenarthrobacter sp. OM7]